MSARSTTWGDLTIALAAEGHLDAAGIERVGAAIAASEAPSESPWYIVALITASAWIGALLLLAFLIAVEWVDEAHEFIAAGVGAMVLSVALGRLTRHAFLQQIGIALSLVGQASLASGCYNLEQTPAHAWAALALAAGVQFIAQPNRVHRFLTVGAAVLGLAGIIAVSERQEALHVLVLAMAFGAVYLLEHEPRLDTLGHSSYTRPLALGLVLALPALLFVAQSTDAFDEVKTMWVSSAGLAIGLLYLVRRVAPWPAIAFTLLFLFFAYDSPGLIASLLLTMLLYARGNRLFTVLLLAVFVANIGYLVYDIDISLLDRAKILGGSGLVLLAMRAVLRLTAPSEPEAGPPHE